MIKYTRFSGMLILVCSLLAGCEDSSKAVYRNIIDYFKAIKQESFPDDSCELIPCDNFDYTLGLEPGEPNIWEDWAYVDSQPAKSLIHSGPVVFSMLKSGQYAELDAYFDKLFQLYIGGKLDEWWFINAVDNAAWNDGAGLAEVDKWIEATDSAFAHQAKAISLQFMAWNIRGGSFVADTPDQDLTTFRSLLTQSLDSINAALELNPKLPSCYRALFTISQGVDKYNSKLDDWNYLMEINLPQAFYPRMKVLEKLTPRWGGSYAQMRDYAFEAQRFYDLNPRLRYLLGYEWYDRGARLESDKRYKEAVEAYSKAIYHGVFTTWLNRRGITYQNIDDHEMAKEDFETTLKIIPHDQVAIRRLAKSYYYLGFIEQSEKLLLQYIELYPTDPIGWSDRGYQQYDQKKFASAAKYFKKAISLNPQYSYASYMYAASLHEINHKDERAAILSFLTLCETATCEQWRVENAKRVLIERGFVN